MTKDKQITALKTVADYWYKEAKKLKEEINQLQTFKDNAKCCNHAKGVTGYICDNKAEHSDGSNLWCSDCWENLEAVYPDSELI